MSAMQYSQWFRKVYSEELKLTKPLCRYCNKTLVNGSQVDGYRPYHNENSWHLSCRRKAEKKQKLYRARLCSQER